MIPDCNELCAWKNNCCQPYREIPKNTFTNTVMAFSTSKQLNVMAERHGHKTCTQLRKYLRHTLHDEPRYDRQCLDTANPVKQILVIDVVNT